MNAFYRLMDKPTSDDNVETFASSPLTAGPWGPDAQHAGPPSALLARAIEHFEPHPHMRLADMRTDILGPVPVAPLEVRVRMLRAGRSMQLLEATASAGGRDVIVGRGWRVARTPESFPTLSGRRNVTPVLPDPSPGTFESRIKGAHMDGYVSVVEWRYEPAASNPEVTGTESHTDPPGTARAWGRQLVPLVEGEEPSPFQRALVLADSGGGITFALDPRTHMFINCDLSVAMDRDLAGEWMRMDAQSLATPGHGGIVHTVLADQEGECGVAVQTMFAAHTPG